MGYTLLNIVIFMLCGFLAMYFIYRPVMNKYMQTLKIQSSMLVFPYILAIYAVGAIVAFFFADLRDFVEPITIVRILVPLILAALIYASTLIFSKKVIYLTVALSLGITIWLQPLGMGNVFALSPTWTRILVLVPALMLEPNCTPSR